MQSKMLMHVVSVHDITHRYLTYFIRVKKKKKKKEYAYILQNPGYATAYFELYYVFNRFLYLVIAPAFRGDNIVLKK